jgi:nucleoside-diphosphate-sugar epimerase
MKKNIVIVGGSGLLGFSIANFLSSSGHNVIISDKNSTKKIKNQNIYFIKCDVTKDNEIDFLISKLNI